MREQLVKIDLEDVLGKSKSLLLDAEVIPPNCPSESCLGIKNISLKKYQTTIELVANPPQLPTEVEGSMWEVDPICESECSIEGNPSRKIIIKQKGSDGICSVRTDWKRD